VKGQLTARLAWFRPDALDPADPLDDTAALIAALRPRYDIDVVDHRQAHAFVWMHDRHPYDLPVYELANTTGAEFIWPYLLRYPGLLVARSRWLLDSRAASLRRQRRRTDYTAELAFGGAPLIRAPLLASRLVVVSAPAHARALQDEYPEVASRVRVAPACAATYAADAPVPRSARPPVRFGVLGTGQLDVINRALQRAREVGVNAELLVDTPARVLREADAILALQWSADDEWPAAALAAMAAGTPVVVLEMETTADWPALDPQTWQPRDPLGATTPAVISIDPRDEEHSLVLAMRRLASSPGLRAELGAAARNWWITHATPNRAAETWSGLIEEAMTLTPPDRPPDWPAHLVADGSETARGILEQLGVTTDIFV
jgi:hypothetical protein